MAKNRKGREKNSVKITKLTICNIHLWECENLIGRETVKNDEGNS